MTENNPSPAPVANLRETRRQMAAAKRASKAARPAGKNAPAKAVPAKKVAARAPTKAADKAAGAAKLKWTYGEGGRDGGFLHGQVAPTADGATYAIEPLEGQVAGKFAGKWKAVVKRGGKTVVLADGVAAGAAYAACVEAAKKAA